MSTDDCDELPTELSEMAPMTDDEFARLRELLEEHVKDMDKDKFDGLISAALWADKDSQRKRLPVVVREIFQTAIHVADREGGIKNVENLRSGVGLVDSLMKIGTSPALDFVQFRRAKTKSSGPMALIFGFAGSSPEEIEAQIKHYLAAGLHVVATTHCPFPRKLRQRQFCRVAGFIRRWLSPDSKLIIHMLSGHGLSYSDNVVSLWLANEAPFNDLPPLEKCFCGAAFECVDLITSTGHATGHAPLRLDPEKDLAENIQPRYYMSAYNIMADLIGKYCPDMSWGSEAAKHRNLLMFLRGSRPDLDNSKATVDNFGANLGFWQGFPQWMNIEAFERPVPRLFLYSTADKLFTPEAVEASIEATWKVSPKARFLTGKCTKSPHTKLWDTPEDRRLCQKIVTDFIKMTRVTATRA